MVHEQEQADECIMNVLRAHAAAVKQFRDIVPGGKIGMNLNAESGLPYDANSEKDKVRPGITSTPYWCDHLQIQVGITSKMHNIGGFCPFEVKLLKITVARFFFQSSYIGMGHSLGLA